MCLQAKHMARFQVHARLQHCTIDLVICSNKVLQMLQVWLRWNHLTRWNDLRWKSLLLVLQWHCILQATVRKVIVTITCNKKGARMHNHLADDDNSGFWISAMITARTIHSQNSYRNGVDCSKEKCQWWTSQAYIWALIVAGPSNKI